MENSGISPDTVFTTFYYSNEEHLNNIDNIQVIRYIQTKYPAIDEANTDLVIKQNLLSLFNDSIFTLKVLKTFDMTFRELLSILISNYQTIFNHYFVKKLITIINDKQYR